MIAKTILVIALFTGGWGPAPQPGPIVGKSYSAAYCISSIGDDPIYDLPEPMCFEEAYMLFTGPVGFEVDAATWHDYALGDNYP